MTGREEVEALAVALFGMNAAARYWVEGAARYWVEATEAEANECRNNAADILASPWLAAREAEVRSKALEEAARIAEEEKIHYPELSAQADVATRIRLAKAVQW